MAGIWLRWWRVRPHDVVTTFGVELEEEEEEEEGGEEGLCVEW